MKNIGLYLLTAALLAGCEGEQTSDANVASADEQQSATPAEPVVELSPLQQRGVIIFKRCRACHTLNDGGRNKVGPNLWDIYGSQSASKTGFAYSKAMKAANIVWDDETMDGYLRKPAEYMPGNKMTFIGLKNQEDRDAVQAYMKLKTAP